MDGSQQIENPHSQQASHMITPANTYSTDGVALASPGPVHVPQGGVQQPHNYAYDLRQPPQQEMTIPNTSTDPSKQVEVNQLFPHQPPSCTTGAVSGAGTSSLFRIEQLTRTRVSNNPVFLDQIAALRYDAFRSKKFCFCLRSSLSNEKADARKIFQTKFGDEKLAACGVAFSTVNPAEVLGMVQLSIASLPGDHYLPDFMRHKCGPAEAYVDWIAVGANARGKGVGTGLLKWADRWALAQKCSMIKLDVVKENPRAFALYERHGYQWEKKHTDFCEKCCDCCVTYALIGKTEARLMRKRLEEVGGMTGGGGEDGTMAAPVPMVMIGAAAPPGAAPEAAVGLDGAGGPGVAVVPPASV